jgi:SNF2 family DNA or RNA helicase
VNRYLIKIAKAQAKVVAKSTKDSDDRPHVADFQEKLDKNDGVLLHWSTGGGKTFMFLDSASKAQAKNKDGRVLIVAPASLTTNIDKEIAKHNIKIDRDRLDVYSYEKATKIAPKLKKNKYIMAIADEAHKLRNASTQRSQALSEIISGADKRILATATAAFNHGADISPLVNMAYGGKVLPEDRKEFEKKFVGTMKLKRSFKDFVLNNPAEEVEILKGRGELGALFKNHVSYYDSTEDPAAKDKFPTVTETTIETEMDPEQARMYKFMEGQIPFWLRMKIRNNLPLDKQEKSQLNSFSTGVRQVSNSHRHLHQDPDSVEYTPKIKKAVASLKSKMSADKNFRGLVYSNYLDAGVHEYSKKLTEEGIDHVTFTGKLSKEEKDQAVKDYNSGKKKVLLISSSGAEGLDLRGTKLIQLLEPHFHGNRGKQVIGRGARYESHAHLPKEERVVEAEHYLSTQPKSLYGHAPTSIDTYLHGMSDNKSKIFDQIKQVMKESN